ncbi:MAG: hypothetical protein U9Q77_09520 [Candidatus Marinimicrobia bacterium]|nr:hypothetical protein [Candidatus Neomarinimicrobiota bacterium]
MIVKHFGRGLLLISISLSVSAFEIYHEAPENFLQGVPGQLEVLTPHYLDNVDFVRLYLKAQDQSAYQELNFYNQEGAWYCDIPASFMNADTLCYYIGASFGPAGLAALPAKDPELYPFKIPLIKFKSKGQKFEPKLMQDVIVDYTVTPWKAKPAFRSNKYPVLYIPKANRVFVESGYIKIIGNEHATAEALLRSMLYLCLQENADAITQLKYSLLSTKPELSKVKGHIELEGVYLRRPPRKVIK